MGDLVYANSGLPGMLSVSIDEDGPYDGAKIALFENEEPITPQTVFADLAEATYDGYAQSSAVTWGTVHLDLEQRAQVLCMPKEFLPTGNSTVSVVHHVGLVDAAGTTLLASYKLDEPLTFASPQDVYLVGFPLVLTQPDGGIPDIVP